jgi:hypothetical protein
MSGIGGDSEAASNKSIVLLYLIFSSIYIFLNFKTYPSLVKLFVFYSIVMLVSDTLGVILGTVNLSDINDIVFVTIIPTVSLIFIYTALSKGHIKFNIFFAMMFLFLIALVILYFYYYYALIIITTLNNSNVTQFNASYSILVALAGGLLIKNKNIKYGLIFVSFIVVFSSLKRGGMIAISLALLFYFFVSLLHEKNKSFAKMVFRFMGLPILGIGLILLLIYMNDYFDIYNRFKNMGQDGGSGRVNIYLNVLGKFADFSFFELLLGRGSKGVYKVLNVSAHNDFLEILFDYGLVGLCALLLILFKLISWNIKCVIKKFKYANILTYTMCAFFVLTMVSHVVIYSIFFLFVIVWGALLAIYLDKQRVVK